MLEVARNVAHAEALDISGFPPKNLSVVETRADLLQGGLSPNEEVH